MPELGQYAQPVLLSYAAGAVLLIALILVSLRRAAKIKKQLSELEKRRGGNG